VVLLDPDSLDVESVIDVPHVVDLAGSPGSDRVVLLRKGPALELLDLKTGRVLDRLDRQETKDPTDRLTGLKPCQL
jgi:hypothetical protein